MKKKGKITRHNRSTFFSGHSVILLYKGSKIAYADYSSIGMAGISDYASKEFVWDTFSVLNFSTKTKAIAVLDSINTNRIISNQSKRLRS